MTTHRSGAHRIDRLETRRLLDELAVSLPPTRAKALPLVVARVEPVSTEHGEVLAALGTLKRQGWGVREIARSLHVSHRWVIDLGRGHRAARTANCDWVARLWGLLATDETALPSGTGW